MFDNPKAPLAFGFVVLLGLGCFLGYRSPTPGLLSAPHQRVSGLNLLTGCVKCHDDRGLATGCLECHEEIAFQLSAEQGYHDHLLSAENLECTPCHLEHYGGEFELVSEMSWEGGREDLFNHPHVSFNLKGTHAELSCEACHESPLRAAFSLPAFPELERERTYLGLTQECLTCHEDIHAGGLSGPCGDCHGQETFRPAVFFDHDRHFPLTGPHERLDCGKCHILPQPDELDGEAELPFHMVTGTYCAECHDSPHRAPWGDSCEDCHPGDAPSWEDAILNVTPELHSTAGFRLVPPHHEVECEDCHEPGVPFDVKYPDPRDPGYRRYEDTCDGCHADVHHGQFAERHDGCLSCHDRLRFTPTRYGLADHVTYPLTGSHAGVDCNSCHKWEGADLTGHRVFAGTPRLCKECHESPHGEQFAPDLEQGDCESCHLSSAETFAIRPFDHAKLTGYELTGAHAKAECEDCHLEIPAGEPPRFVRMYRGNSTECESCHGDSHYGQFKEKWKNRCERCHTSTSSWETIEFYHNLDSRFQLDGVHAKVKCGNCHPRVKLANGDEITQYKPLGMECEDCHGFIVR